MDDQPQPAPRSMLASPAVWLGGAVSACLWYWAAQGVGYLWALAHAG